MEFKLVCACEIVLEEYVRTRNFYVRREAVFTEEPKYLVVFQTVFWFKK